MRLDRKLDMERKKRREASETRMSDDAAKLKLRRHLRKIVRLRELSKGQAEGYMHRFFGEPL